MSERDNQLDALIHQIALDCHMPEAVVRKGIAELVQRGHLRLVVNSEGALGVEFLLKSAPQ